MSVTNYGQTGSVDAMFYHSTMALQRAFFVRLLRGTKVFWRLAARRSPILANFETQRRVDKVRPSQNLTWTRCTLALLADMIGLLQLESDCVLKQYHRVCVRTAWVRALLT
jgi:hypothetical protein